MRPVNSGIMPNLLQVLGHDLAHRHVLSSPRPAQRSSALEPMPFLPMRVRASCPGPRGAAADEEDVLGVG